MFLLDDVVVTSASDLATASKCEFAFLRALDAKLGRTDRVAQKADAMLERAGRLGDAHEAAVLERYREQFGAFAGEGTGVVEIARPSAFDAEARDAALTATREAFASGAAVVFQAAFFTDDFIGFADFIVRQPDGRYLVQDTKLARSVRVTALLQLAAYVQQLEAIGVPVADTVQLLLGDGSTSEHRVADIMPVYRRRRARLLRIIAERRAEPGVVAWGDARYTSCGQCESCEAEIQAHRDVFLVAGLRASQRLKLRDAGIRTIDELAAFGEKASDDGAAGTEGAEGAAGTEGTEGTGGIEGIGDAALAGLVAQARLQLQAMAAGSTAQGVPPFEVVAASALEALPMPDAGDIFFDFEGDPLYSESGSEHGASQGAPRRWGLDYLFGLIEPDHRFRAFWAHNHAEERQALIDFLGYVAERRAAHPGMHIYHYAAYERTHLLSLAARHGVGEQAVDQLLRDNVLVDLYPIVRAALRVGSRSYSIKKLEPLYMGEEQRDAAGVTNAADSITEYAEAMALLDAGRSDPAQAEAGRRKLGEIASYNEYDCRSTLELRDWLLGLAREHGITPAAANADRDAVIELAPSPLRDALLARAGDPLDLGRSADQTAAAFAAAALDYHQREQKSFWWEHFARLENPIAEWADTRDVMVVESATVERDWHREGKQRVDRRWLRLRGQVAPGSSIKKGEQAGPFLLYDSPAPWPDERANPWARAAKSVQVLDVDEDGGVLVLETLPRDAEPYARVPVALTPASPPPAGAQKDAIAGWAQSIVDAGRAGDTGASGWPRDAVVDLLRRVAPRRPEQPAAHAEAQPETATVLEQVITATLALDHQALAVQGPPGTGKTYLGAHLITELVEKHGYKIGVVAQSHAVVENLLEGVVRAGLDRALVGKVPKSGTEPGVRPPGYTELEKNSHLLFALDHAESGFVIGGTAWDFANPARFTRRSLDLLVIDEAGQFSLASTIAASVAATNLLLLGDPQQLPQVSQGTHPEPVDQSALGWVSAGHDVLPPEFGFFLAESRRMHPAVTAPVSALSYEGALRAHPVAGERLLDGIAPGLRSVAVAHRGNSTASTEEAAAVVELVRAALGRAWSESAALGENGQRMSRPLGPRDVIVVTPYNAQLQTVHAALTAAGLGEVRVGTVDKFQGQEAAVAIMSLAASSAEDVPRGMGFLIMKNRLNVAISRAKWAAYLLYSPELIEYLPVTPDGLAELSAFIGLVEAGR